jgi:hypothetical protein
VLNPFSPQLSSTFSLDSSFFIFILLKSHGSSVANMPKDQQTRVPRQRPVSCRFCRSRKLRCNRESPCSNCVSRGVACELENIVRPPSGVTSSSESELLERIRKLERIIENQHIYHNETAKPHHPNPSTPLRQMNSSTVSLETKTETETGVETLDNDIAYLESIYSNHELLVSYLTC